MAVKYKPLPEARIRAWLQNHFDVKERKGGTELLICNPFSDDTKYKFNISPIKGVCHCWTGDEWAGPVNPATGKRNCSIARFVMAYRKCTYVEAIKEIMGSNVGLEEWLRPGHRVTTADDENEPDLPIMPVGVQRLADHANDAQASAIIQWLETRGYSLEDIDKHDLQYLGMSCYWPYHEFGSLVYYQSRSRVNKRFEFPAIGTTEGSKGDYLYGFDDAESASDLYLTEAIFGQHTLGRQALASGGAILTERQVSKINVLGPAKGIILAPDNDMPGKKSALANCALLKPLGYPIGYSVPPAIPFTANGETRLTKDWNEFVQYLGWSLRLVRAMCEERVVWISGQGSMPNHLALAKECFEAGAGVNQDRSRPTFDPTSILGRLSCS